MLPVCHSFACFLSTRPNEQIYNQATEQTKVVYVGSLAGVVPGGPGHSHQSVRDIATLASVPGLVLIEPSCEAETALATEFALTQARARSTCGWSRSPARSRTTCLTTTSLWRGAAWP